MRYNICSATEIFVLSVLLKHTLFIVFNLVIVIMWLYNKIGYNIEERIYKTIK